MRFELWKPGKAALVALAVMASGLAQADDLSWPLAYAGKSTNDLVRDKRVGPLVNTRLPSSLAEDVVLSLGGPPDPVIVKEGRYVSASACRPHDCGDKAFFWIDTRTGAGLGAIVGYRGFMIGSNAIPAANIPAPAMQALLDWIRYADISPDTVTFVGRDGKTTELDAGRFTLRPDFVPPPSGPSFDCSVKLPPVRRTVCTHPALAQQDMGLAQLVDRLHHGVGTTIAQDELAQLQQAWMDQRDRTCAQAPDVAACLDEAYRKQYDRLENWIPTKR